MANKPGGPKLLLYGVILIGVLAILGVSIAVLVKVFKDDKTKTDYIYVTEGPNTPAGNPTGGQTAGPTSGLTGGPTGAPTGGPTSETASKTQAPPNNNLNIPTNSPLNPTSNRTSAYDDFIRVLKQNVKTDEDPCNNFWAYACGNIGNNSQSFDYLTDKNYQVMAAQFANNSYVISAPLPVQLANQHYQTCVRDSSNWSAIIQDGSIIKQKIVDFQKVIDLPMPAIYQQDVSQPLSRDVLGSTLGYLSGRVFTNTLVSAIVDTNWKNPNAAPGYALYVDQSSQGYDNTYYQKPKAWADYKNAYFNTTYTQIATVAKVLNATQNLDDSKLQKQTMDVLEFEWNLANNYSTLDSVRRHYNRSYNQYTINQVNVTYPFINWTLYLDQLLTYAPDNVRSYAINNTKFYFLVMEPDQLSKIQNDYTTKSGSFVNPGTLVNWLYVRLLQANAQYIPVPKTSMTSLKLIHKSKRSPLSKNSKFAPILPTFDPMEAAQKVGDVNYNGDCMNDNVFGIQYANARLFIDGLIPNPKDRAHLRSEMAKFVTLILDSFQGMLNQLGWMDQSTKQDAYAKISNLVKNMAYPDFITDDNALMAYYTNLAFSPNDSYAIITEKVNIFNQYLQWKQLDPVLVTNRQDFLSAPGTVNAWYQPELNSISFPIAILQRPFFDPSYPAAVNYGAIGMVGGHELTHAFDDEGVQWDPTGALKGWMDTNSSFGFQKMANCVISEYDHFCPSELMKYGNFCVDGSQTQGENIADNGGIRAAYRAYQSHVALYGQDPRLPDDIFGGYTNDQLFFLSFGQVWCQSQPDPGTLLKQLLVDPHSPSEYRVFGTIQNFPQFRAAFNCPANSKYAPDDHCSVWTSEVTPVLGIPSTTTTPIPPNVPTMPTNNNEKYKKAAQYFESSIDTSKDPCNDFYGYACGNYENAISFDIVDYNDFYRTAQALKVQSNSDPLTIQKAKQLFAACQTAYFDNSTYLTNGNITKQILEGFLSYAGLQFPLLNSSYSASWPDKNQLARTLGYLSGRLRADTFLTSSIDTNWKHPHQGIPYILYVDQPSLVYDWDSYIGLTWNITIEDYRPAIHTLLNTTLLVYGVDINATDVQNKITAVTQSILDLEYTLANNFSTNSSTRRNSKRNYNPIRVVDANTNFSFINFTQYIQEISYNADPSVTQKMIQSTYKFIVEEPEKLKMLQENFNPNNNWDFTPEQIINYLCFRVLWNNQNYLPIPKKSFHLFDNGKKLYRPVIGKPEFIRKRTIPRQLDQSDAQYMADITCSETVLENMQYAQARVFVDLLFPTQQDRDNIRKEVGKVAESILIGMRSMIDQISWMSQEAKKGAYYKIDNLVKNVAYPDFIYDITALDAYYSKLVFETNGTTTKDYVTMLNDLTKFTYWTSYNYTTFTDIKRDDFNGAPGVVNAWYQPEMNSITFPAAILQEPFFDADWPAAINFGAMGVIAGHELTHGFDDEGVQWDGTGVLSTWMDANSSAAFHNMSKCVIDEYHQFCPLNASYHPNCIDGVQTQGENIADNGGIHSAFRAYRNYMNFNEPDQKLPGDLVGQFTHDQLFFLSFAQVWCQLPDSPDTIYRQLLTDVHSPSKYRVWGTLKNFPAFQSAFNCPVGTNYTKVDHCNVWISDINSVTGIPPTTALVPDLNIPQAQQVTSNSNVSAKYEKYAQLLTNSIDTTVDPCEDFYQYACGKYQEEYVSVFDMMNNNFMQMADAIEYVEKIETELELPFQQLSTYYRTCLAAMADLESLLKNGTQIKGHMDGFKNYTGVCFPLFDKNCAASWLDNKQLAKTLGSLSGLTGTDTFLTSYVDTNWEDPQGPHPYILFVDQPTLANPWIYYVEPAWNATQDMYLAQIFDIFSRYALVKNVSIDNATMIDVAKNIMQLEVILANQLSTDEITRRNFARSYNLYYKKTAQANYSFIDWNVYLTEVFAYAQFEVQTLMSQNDTEFVVMEPNKTALLAGLLKANNTYGITAETLYNYLSFRLLLTHQDVLYHPPKTYLKPSPKPKMRLNKPPLGRPKFVAVRKELKNAEDNLLNRITCAENTMNNMQYANARVFIDYVYPVNTMNPMGTNRTRLRESVQKIADSIVIGFRSMIDQIYWMSYASKKGAYDKIDNLVKNIAYPDWIMNNTALGDYYQPLNVSVTSLNVSVKATDYFVVSEAITQFNLWLKWSYLNRKTQWRTDFLSPPGIVNAWYQPELNSITFPTGILQSPFFDPDYPASVNFGAIGIVSGHELTHGFDDQGVQWDGTGVLLNWMDSQSTDAFKQMAECVINEYDGFCPLEGQINPATGQPYDPACIIGNQTQGENIADNGGIHAAFRAYKNYINLHGPDPQLPGGFLSQYTHDQLFFLSFGQIWCQLPDDPKTAYMNLLTDVHSPSKYRVRGSIQNFPAFRSAFNCPINSTYAPENHCNVWTSDIEPPNGTPAPNQVNVGTNPSIKADDPKYPVYKTAMENFKYSMNLSVDPCSNFYEYACGNYQKPLTFSLYRRDNQLKMAARMEQLIAQNYTVNGTSSTVKKLLNFYSACNTAQKNMPALIADGSKINKIIDDFAAYTGLVFPLYSKNQSYYKALPDATTLAKALAYLSAKTGVDTLVSPLVDVEPMDLKQNSTTDEYWQPKKYKVWIDQNTLTYDKSYYQGKTFNITLADFYDVTVTLMRNYTIVQNANLTDTDLSNATKSFFDLEHTLASSLYSTNDTTRRKMRRSVNYINLTDANPEFSFIDWPTYMTSLTNLVNATPLANLNNFTAVFMEVDVTHQLSVDIKNSSKFDPNLVVNYLFFRLLSAYQQFVPQPKNPHLVELTNDFNGLGMRSKWNRQVPNIWAKGILDQVEDIQSDCALDTQNYMQYANSRIFTEYLYPTPEDRTNVNKYFLYFSKTKLFRTIRKFAKNILSSFQGMLDSLEWLDEPSKTAAFAKISHLKINVAFPDFVMNDTLLDKYYENLNFTPQDDYFSMIAKLTPYNNYLQYNKVTSNADVDRFEFNGAPGTVNAWYQPELNSITFPEGILRQPYYDPNWPASINYGAMGLVAGHELTHGFDDSGVQYNDFGGIVFSGSWMTNQSYSNFTNMAQCVINEYQNFTALDCKKYSPCQLNGENTQGENIADNGGIHSSYNAYRNHIALYGPDPRLPDVVFNQFTHDQLFFLSFGQVWCQAPPTPDQIYKQILTDPHSPSLYRIFGTLQNFPAFRAAFNCPLGSPYAPESHCSVWVPEPTN